jgi:RNA polymerase sigma-70 factor (ECF subfamily)
MLRLERRRQYCPTGSGAEASAQGIAPRYELNSKSIIPDFRMSTYPASTPGVPPFDTARRNQMNALSPVSEYVGASLFRPKASRRAHTTFAAKDGQLSALMSAAQRGDQLAYAKLLREVIPLLRRLLRSRFRCLQAADCDDLIQDVMLSLHRSMAKYDPGRAFVPWLTAIARNRAIDRARRCARLSTNETLVDEWTAIETQGGFGPYENEYSDPAALWRAMKQLPAGQYAAIVLMKIRGLSSRDAASVTGMSKGALRVAAHRAVKTLRRSLS